MPRNPTKSIEHFILTDWELDVLARHAASMALQYLGHYGVGAGLRRDEVDTMNRWNALSAKLSGDPPPEPHPYAGYRANGFNPEAD